MYHIPNMYHKHKIHRIIKHMYVNMCYIRWSAEELTAFELWCWRRLLRVPWTARRSNQSILREINLGYSLKGLMLKLKLQYFGHLMGTADSLEKSLMLGKIESRKRRGRKRMRWLDGISEAMDVKLEQTLGDGDGQGGLVCCSPWGHKELDMAGWLNKSNSNECYGHK